MKAVQIGVSDGRVELVIPSQDTAIALEPEQAERLGGTIVDASFRARE